MFSKVKLSNKELSSLLISNFFDKPSLPTFPIEIMSIFLSENSAAFFIVDLTIFELKAPHKPLFEVIVIIRILASFLFEKKG